MSTQAPLSRAERHRQQLRAEIVEAAFVEFSERGYHQTAISDVAQRLGIGHGTFYRHFANKRDILEHVIDDTVSKLQAVLSAENAPSVVTSLAEYREQCERISARFQEFAISNPRAIRLLLLEATSIDPQMTQRVLSLIDMGGAFTATYLKNGVERGFFRADLDIEQTGHAITGLIMSGILRYLSAPDNLDALERYGDAVIDLLVAGMAAQG
jgi:AcrR family transcriptional regulator